MAKKSCTIKRPAFSNVFKSTRQLYSSLWGKQKPMKTWSAIARSRPRGLQSYPGRRRQSYPGRQTAHSPFPTSYLRKCDSHSQAGSTTWQAEAELSWQEAGRGLPAAGSPPPYSLALVYTPLLRRYWLPAHPSHPIPIAAARRKSGLRGCCDFRFSYESKGLANLRFPNAQIITNVLGLSNPDRPNVKCCSWSFVKQVANQQIRLAHQHNSRLAGGASAIIFKNCKLCILAKEMFDKRRATLYLILYSLYFIALEATRESRCLASPFSFNSSSFSASCVAIIIIFVQVIFVVISNNILSLGRILCFDCTNPFPFYFSDVHTVWEQR